MEIKNVWAVYFSPGDNTRKVVEVMAEGARKALSLGSVKAMDITLREKRTGEITFKKSDLVFFGVPTYAGRVPNKIMPFIRECIKGNGAHGVAVVTYGNRNFDDSLMELFLLMKENEFIILGASAMVTEHSFAGALAKGRPSYDDLHEAMVFGEDIVRKGLTGNEVLVPGNNPPAPYYVPRKWDGEPARFLKAVPKTDRDKCSGCGICADLCPMGSISREDFSVVSGICIKCQSCVIRCPGKAKYFDDPDFLSHKDMLEENYSHINRKNSFYL